MLAFEVPARRVKAPVRVKNSAAGGCAVVVGAPIMFAIVEAGGRQEKVEPGVLVIVDRLDAEPGAEITFKVLLVETDGGDVMTGTPYVAGASVTGVVEAQSQGKKIRVFKMKRRKHYRKTKGHRTQQTRVRVKSINVA